MRIDDPAVIAEARAVFDRYEAALMANRTEELDAIFWADPRTVRFGITEILYGHDAIRAFRAGVKAYARRVQKRVQMTAFGPDVVATHLEYERVGTGLVGRETKIMARIPGEGWRVVSAHVSLLAGVDPGRQEKPAGGKP
ncbi:AtzH-like domain-containing protein [Falsiroseomonas sp.]|uniref:AtzH-like domain-containing protein n=1 Tax=Falsiroseomonas sp. TaxID=2870721 RepID=UPI003F70D427